MVSNYFVKCFLAQGQKESIFSPMLIHFVYRGEFFGVSDRDTLSVQYNKADFFSRLAYLIQKTRLRTEPCLFLSNDDILNRL